MNYYNIEKIKTLIKTMHSQYISLLSQSFKACEDSMEKYQQTINGKKYIELNKYKIHIRGLRAEVFKKLKEINNE